MDIVNEYFKANAAYAEAHGVFPYIRCADGFQISVQAHYGAYCTPRPISRDEEKHINEYYNVECGFPSGPVPELAKWKDGDGPDEQTLYGYVPVSVVNALIEKHGGLDQPSSGSQS